jgi:hypothetical protein
MSPPSITFAHNNYLDPLAQGYTTVWPTLTEKSEAIVGQIGSRQTVIVIGSITSEHCARVRGKPEVDINCCKQAIHSRPINERNGDFSSTTNESSVSLGRPCCLKLGTVDHSLKMRRNYGESSAPDVVVANHLEYRQKTSGAKKLPNRFPNVEELQSAVCRFCGHIQPNERAEARAVHVG